MLILERRLGDWARARLSFALAEFVMFVLKQGWACLFGGLLLVLIIATRAIWPDDPWLARYDFLVLAALALQLVFLRLGLESLDEAKVIVLFHLTGTAMEIFKVSQGSWSYPEPGLLKLAGVPLFSGFMYGAVGSYIARVTRLFSMHFAPFPPLAVLWGLALGIYLNFFAHHYIIDLRWVLIAASVVFFFKTRVWFVIHERAWWMPMPFAAFLASFFLWVAENIGTLTGTWLYARQGAFELVSLQKMGSWYMLLWVAFATVTLVLRDMLVASPLSVDAKGRLLVGPVRGHDDESDLPAHDGARSGPREVDGVLQAARSDGDAAHR